MTISSAILALNPTLYWKLDDGTGPAASDSSGNGNPGIYYGQFALHQPGPEVGTFSAAFIGGGGCRTNGQSPRHVRDYSMLVFVANELVMVQNGGVVYNGNGQIDGAGAIWAPANAINQPIELLHGGQGQTAALGALNALTWHMVAVSESAAGNAIVWVDNVQVYNTGGNNPNNPGVNSPFQINSPLAGGAAAFAHAALFPTVLTNANVASVWGAGTFQVPPNTLGIAPGDIASIEASLAAILAAVQHTFPTT